MDTINQALGLLSNECYIVIVLVLIIAYFIIRSNQKHQQIMEKIRLEQYAELMKGGKS